MIDTERLTELYDWSLDRDSSQPMNRQIYLRVRSAILGGVFKAGSKLPPSRTLARELGVARATVVAAYAQLAAEGYTTGRTGAGSYVSVCLEDVTPVAAGVWPASERLTAVQEPSQPLIAQTVSFSAYYDEARPFNTGRALIDAHFAANWRKCELNSMRSMSPGHLGYTDPRGDLALRTRIADYLRVTRAVVCAPDQIIITSGTQHALDIVCKSLLVPGDRVWLEDPCYTPAKALIDAHGAQVQPIPADGEGVRVDEGAQCAPEARLAYVTPSHQFPLGVVMSLKRRLALLRWADRAGAWIVEDDYQSEFRYGGAPISSLQGLHPHGRVIYVGTLNKALFPGLRLGYLVAPRSIAEMLVRTRELSDRQPPTVTQAMASEFIASGYLVSHIKRMRSIYKQQRDTLVETLSQACGDLLDVTSPDQGMHLVAFFRCDVSDIAFESYAYDAGVVVRALSRFYCRQPARSGILLGFSGYPKRDVLTSARKLAHLLRTFCDTAIRSA